MYINTDILNRIIEEIRQHDTIIIHRHERPDPDAIGSQLGLKVMIEDNFPNKRVLAAGTTTKGLSWMGQMDDINKEDYKNSLVIICDTANQERIDGKYYSLGETLIKIDHHPMVDNYGDVQMVHPQAAACCEILTMFSQCSQGRLKLTEASAKLLYTGLISDTGRFLFNSTTSDTLLMAAELMRFKFDAFSINDHFQTMTRDQAKFEAYVMNQLTIVEDQIAYVTISKEEMASYGISEEETHLVVQLPGKVHGIKSWMIFVEQDGRPQKWRVRIRSKGPEIHNFAAKHHGGGHPMASGAYAFSQEEKNEMVEELLTLARDHT